MGRLPTKMDFEKFLRFKRARGLSAGQELSEDAIEQATSPRTRTNTYVKQNILHDGLWSRMSDEEEQAPSEESYDHEKIGTFGVWCFLGGVAVVTLVNYMFQEPAPPTRQERRY